MSAFVAAEWPEHHLRMAQMDYPDLPLHEAMQKYFDDVYIRYPRELARPIAAALPHLAERAPEIAGVVGMATGVTPFTVAGQAGVILRDTIKATLQASNTNPVGVATGSAPIVVAGPVAGIDRDTIRATSQASNASPAPGTIASELKRFNNPDLIGQIANVGAMVNSTAAVVYIKKMADQAERIANGLDRIGDHIRSENIRGDKFPGHVHSFVKSMIEKHREEDVPHYFFVFNQGTEWQPKFDDINRADPLGPHYLGYSHDLDELVDFLAGTARPRLGPEAIFHILVPVVSQLAITESLTFPDEMGPFRVSGQLGEGGLPCVYLCVPLQKDRANLRGIGSLRPPPR